MTTMSNGSERYQAIVQRWTPSQDRWLDYVREPLYGADNFAEAIEQAKRILPGMSSIWRARVEDWECSNNLVYVRPAEDGSIRTFLPSEVRDE